MTRFLFIIAIAAMSCCSTKKSSDTVKAVDNAVDTTVYTKKEINFDADTSLPVCLKDLIRKFQKEEKQNPPRSVYRYTYDGKLVYYVPAICCDFFSDLYDQDCKLIGHPDGGYTGKGDGKMVDFLQARSGERLIWQDER